LAGIRRHDYLPFGEELVASTGAQRSGVGYEPPASNVKQRFDAYERDNETGLDFAQARYYSSIQGRFTSADEPFADQFEGDPQSWNLYAFVRNNPCSNTDPTGRNSCYYRPDGSKIGCDGQTNIQIVTEGGKGTITYTPKNGPKEVYDLDKVKAETYASTAPDPIRELGFEMNRRAPGMQGLIGRIIGTGVAGGVGAGLLLPAIGGGGITTLTSGGAFSASGATFSGNFAIIGSRLTTMTYSTLSGAGVLNMANWSSQANQGWIQQIITQRVPVYLSSPLTRQFLVNARGEATVFAREVQQLLAAGYTQFGKWLVPPK